MLTTKLPHPQPAFGSGSNGNGGMTVADFGSGGSNRSRYRPEPAEPQDALALDSLDFMGSVDLSGIEGLPDFAAPAPVTVDQGALLPTLEHEAAQELSDQEHALLKLRAIFADPDNPEDMAAIRILQEHEQRKSKMPQEQAVVDEPAPEQPKSLALLAYLEF